MTKREAISFIESLHSNVDGRILFVSHETMDDGRENTRTVNTTKDMMLQRLTDFFDDNLHGSFRDGVMTTILSLETLIIEQ